MTVFDGFLEACLRYMSVSLHTCMETYGVLYVLTDYAECVILVCYPTLLLSRQRSVTCRNDLGVDALLIKGGGYSSIM